MIEVVSLLGISYSGKSTIAEALQDRLDDEGLETDIIKKDQAMRALGEERYGKDDRSGGYSISGFMRNGQIASSELHNWMNQKIRTSLELGHIAILEGGTRARTAQAETLEGIDLDEDGLRIFMLELPLREILSRARKRRQESGRYDDMLPVALAKLYGQYKGIHSPDAPQTSDPDVRVLDASMPTGKLVEIVSEDIIRSRTV